MKRSTRECLIAHAPFHTALGRAAQDALDSDARQRAEIRDLKARLTKTAALACACFHDTESKYLCRAHSGPANLKNKDWNR